MQTEQQEVIIEAGKKPFVCPSDPAERDICDSCA